MISCPIAGAIAGTRMKIVIATDTIRAISRPEKRSRTIAIETTRGPAAPKPWQNRATNTHSSEEEYQANIALMI